MRLMLLRRLHEGIRAEERKPDPWRRQAGRGHRQPRRTCWRAVRVLHQLYLPAVTRKHYG